MATTVQSEIAIDGYSPVSYFENGQAELGSDEHAVIYDGKTYHLTSAGQAETFRADPEKYVPQHGGACAYGASKGENFPVDPTNFKIVDDRLLLFLKNDEVDARQLWENENSPSCSTGTDTSCSC